MRRKATTKETKSCQEPFMPCLGHRAQQAPGKGGVKNQGLEHLILSHRDPLVVSCVCVCVTR